MTVVENKLRTNKRFCYKCYDRNWLVECACGCRQIICKYGKNNKLKKYIIGHQSKFRNFKGENHPRWKGYTEDKDGYIYIWKPDHPFANKKRNVFAHRLIYENYLSIIFDEEVFIPKEYEIHHIIPVKESGTNALINLELLTHKEHKEKHRKDFSNRICILCQTNNPTKRKTNGRPDWRLLNNEWICNKCYMKIRRK